MTREEAIMSLLPLAKRFSRLYKESAGWLTWEDLLQEAMVGAIEAVDRYLPDGPASLGQYAGFVMRGRVLHAIRDRNHLKAQAKEQMVDQAAILLLEEQTRAVEGTAAHIALREAIMTALARLPERERVCLLLHYWADWPLEDIGALWGITRFGASKVHRLALSHLGGAWAAQEMAS